MKITKKLILSIVTLLISFSCTKTDDIITLKDKEIDRFYKLATNKKNETPQRLADVNSAFKLVDSTTSYDLAKKILDLKTYLHNKNKELDSAIFYTKVLLKTVKRNDDISSEGKTYFKLGRYYDKKGQLDSAFYNYNESKNKFYVLNDSIQIGRRCLNMAIILSDIGDYSSSDELAIEGLKYLENSNDDEIIASLENCLAISASIQGDYEDALIRYDRAIAHTAKELKKLIYINNRANIYIDKEEYSKAIDLFESIIDNPKLSERIKFKAKVIDNYAYARWLQTKDMRYEDEFLNALRMRLSIGDGLGEISSYNHLSEFYRETDFNLSKTYALKMYERAIEINSLTDRIDALKLLMDLNELDNTYTKYSKRFVKLTDSIENVRYRKTNQYAKIRYESEKGKAIISELEAASIKKELSLERLEKQRTLVTVLIIALLLVGYAIYKNIKIRHKKEKMVQVYQTETNISKRIHDEIANDVYNAMTKLQSAGAVNKEAVIDDLDYVYKRARDISKEHGSIDVEDNFEDVLSDLFLNFESDNVRIITRGMSKIDWNTIDELKRTTIYRVLQELLVNMKKHSKANIISISFKALKKKVDIQYSDNGVGCDIKKKGGLLNVENRILSFGGTVTFDSEKDKGFNVSIEI